jgi:tetratricopeptide (TPR) repeat protein
MAWVIAAAIAVILIYRFLHTPARQAKALSFSAMHARNRRNWALAAEFYSESHQMASKLNEPLRSQIESQVEVQWAAMLYRQGLLRDAEDMLRQGLSKGERHFAADSEMLVQGSLCWGDLCTDEGRHVEAEGHYRKALAGDEPHDNIAGMMFDLQRLGDCLIRQERRAEAEAVIERAVAFETRHAREFAISRGMDPDKYLLTPISLPTLHFCREQYEDARRLYRGQVEHWEAQAKRPDNIDIGQLQMKLALADARAGHLEEAIDAYERAASVFERDWCPGHPKALAASVAKAALEASVEPRV